MEKNVTLRPSKGDQPFKQGAYFENLSMTSKKNLITVSFSVICQFASRGVS
jgi:hypothetical protein